MINPMKRVYEEHGDIDRISSLPEDVIDHILEFLSTHDAARTCVLSIKWRYIWANHPRLVAGKEFRDTIKQKSISKKLGVDYAVDALNRMFIHHIGHINEFVLDISVARSERHGDVDLWLSFLSRKGVKVLKLENSVATSYTVPSCVFSNSDLTDLSISDCIIKTTKPSTALHKLETLHLENVDLFPGVLETPLLYTLTLAYCDGIHDFILCAPQLVRITLTVLDSGDINLVPYLTCSDIEYANIYVEEKNELGEDVKTINLIELLRCWPKISKFILDGSSLQYLTTGLVPEEFALKLSLRNFVVSDTASNLCQTVWILRILQNSPVLHKFQIWFSIDVSNDLEVANYLEKPNVMNQRMEHLRVVKMNLFTATRAQLLFTKILLRNAPSLERMLVEEDEKLDPFERLKIAKELMRLMRLPRASPNAEIIFGPNLVL